MLITLMMTCSVFAYENAGTITGVTQEGNLDYYLDRNETFDEADLFLNARIRAYKEKGYYQEITDEFIDSNIEYLVTYYRLSDKYMQAENELHLLAARHMDNPLSIETLKRDIDSFIEIEGKNFDEDQLQKLLILNQKLLIYRAEKDAYYEKHKELSKSIWNFVYENDGDNFKYNFYVLPYRVDDRLPDDEKIFTRRYERPVEVQATVEIPKADERVLALVTSSLDSKMIIVQNQTSNVIDMSGYKMVLEGNEFEIEGIILAPNDMLQIQAPSNTSVVDFEDIHQLTIPEVFWTGGLILINEEASTSFEIK